MKIVTCLKVFGLPKIPKSIGEAPGDSVPVPLGKKAMRVGGRTTLEVLRTLSGPKVVER